MVNHIFSTAIRKPPASPAIAQTHKEEEKHYILGQIKVMKMKSTIQEVRNKWLYKLVLQIKEDHSVTFSLANALPRIYFGKKMNGN